MQDDSQNTISKNSFLLYGRKVQFLESKLRLDWSARICILQGYILQSGIASSVTVTRKKPSDLTSAEMTITSKTFFALTHVGSHKVHTNSFIVTAVQSRVSAFIDVYKHCQLHPTLLQSLTSSNLYCMGVQKVPRISIFRENERSCRYY